MVFVSFDGGQLLWLLERPCAGSVWVDAENPMMKLKRGRVQRIDAPVDDLIDACAQIRQFCYIDLHPSCELLIRDF